MIPLNYTRLSMKRTSLSTITANGSICPWLRTEMAKYGLTPPAPAKEVDLYQVVKRQFRLPSNHLDDALESFELIKMKL